MGVREDEEAARAKELARVQTRPAGPRPSRFVPTPMELCRPIINVLKKGKQEHEELRKAVARNLDFPYHALKTKYLPEGGASFANNFHLAMQHLHRNKLIVQTGKFLSAVLDVNGRALPIPPLETVSPGMRNPPDTDPKWPIDLETLRAELPTLPFDRLLAYYTDAANYEPPDGKKRMSRMINSVIAASHVQQEFIRRGIMREDGKVNEAAFARAYAGIAVDVAFHWPSTKNTGGDGSMEMQNVPDISPLKLMGYTVGKNGQAQWERRRLLTKAFQGPIPDSPEIEQWGDPNTSVRLKKMAYHLALLTRNDKRKRTRDMSEAIQMREDDLEFLRVTYYVGRFDRHWRWPSTQF